MTHHTKAPATAKDSSIGDLISALESRDGMQRRHAREALEQMGSEATPLLIEALQHRKVRVRWEAAKALVGVKDPGAAPALVKTLMDEAFEIQWLAAEALIAIGQDALIPLMRGLISNWGSIYLRQGAHHVLHDLERRHLLGPPLLHVLDDLRCLEPLEPYPISAKRALEELQSEHEVARNAVKNKVTL